MNIEKTIEGLTDEIDFMIGMGTAPLVGESARRILLSQQEEINNLHSGISIFQKENVELIKKVKHWKSNHDNAVTKLRGYTSRPDLTINKQQERIEELEYAIQRISGMEEEDGRFNSDDALAEAFNICREV